MSCDLCLPLPLEWRGVSKAPCPDPRLPGLQSTHVSHENICHSLLNGYSLKMIFFSVLSMAVTQNLKQFPVHSRPSGNRSFEELISPSACG